MIAGFNSGGRRLSIDQLRLVNELLHGFNHGVDELTIPANNLDILYLAIGPDHNRQINQRQLCQTVPAAIAVQTQRLCAARGRMNF